MSCKFYLGIDVSKATLAVSLQNSASKTIWSNKKIANSMTGFKQMMEHVTKAAAKNAGCEDYTIAVGMESTGVYGESLACYLADNNKEGKVSVYVLNPSAVKSYRDALMFHNKNDASDAKLIAMFLSVMTENGQITPWQAPSPEERTLRELSRRRMELVMLKEAERNRLEKFRTSPQTPSIVIENVHELIAHLERLILEIETEIEKHINNTGLRETADLLRSIDGIGKVSAPTFIGEMGDISRYKSVKNLVSRVGIAPKDKQSGTSLHGHSVISRRGSAIMRQTLYMATLVATQKNAVISAFYKSLLARGKSKKLALIASMRKLLHIIWGVLTHKTAFDAEYATK